MKYQNLVDYTKQHHISWNTDLFDVLRGFFEDYSSQKYSPSYPPSPSLQQDHNSTEFREPEEGEYSNNDLLNLFDISP